MSLNKYSKSVTVLTLLSFYASTAFCQNNDPEPGTADNAVVIPLSRLEFQLALVVLGFSLIVIAFEFFLIKTKRVRSDDAMKFIIITLIITSTLFLIAAGYDNNQIAPAMGLLGTIAGYLLGRMNNDPGNLHKKNNHDKEAIQKESNP